MGTDVVAQHDNQLDT